MLSLSDPCDLKPPDVYRQAKLVASKTSRGRDRNWYRSAFELPWQWHIWFDGGRDVVSATYSRHDSSNDGTAHLADITAIYDFSEEASFLGEEWQWAAGYSYAEDEDGSRSHTISVRLTLSYENNLEWGSRP